MNLDELWRTPLHRVSEITAPAMELLLSRGADIHLKDMAARLG